MAFVQLLSENNRSTDSYVTSVAAAVSDYLCYTHIDWLLSKGSCGIASSLLYSKNF